MVEAGVIYALEMDEAVYIKVFEYNEVDSVWARGCVFGAFKGIP